VDSGTGPFEPRELCSHSRAASVTGLSMICSFRLPPLSRPRNYLPAGPGPPVDRELVIAANAVHAV
jgi:hypothetical protein